MNNVKLTNQTCEKCGAQKVQDEQGNIYCPNKKCENYPLTESTDRVELLCD